MAVDWHPESATTNSEETLLGLEKLDKGWPNSLWSAGHNSTSTCKTGCDADGLVAQPVVLLNIWCVRGIDFLPWYPAVASDRSASWKLPLSCWPTNVEHSSEKIAPVCSSFFLSVSDRLHLLLALFLCPQCEQCKHLEQAWVLCPFTLDLAQIVSH